MQPQTCLRQHLLCTQAELAVQAGLRQILPGNETSGVSEPDIIAMGLHAIEVDPGFRTTRQGGIVWSGEE